MNHRQRRYVERVNALKPQSSLGRDCLRAFWVGGTICLLGQGFLTLYGRFLEADAAALWTSVTLIFLGALLTGLGVYDKLGRYAGAGSVVPITGFANGIASPAMEFRTEGLVMGLGAKMFVIAGPVIVYGVCSSAAVGLIYYIITRVS